MAYCYKCGKPLIDGDRFCTHCGTEQFISNHAQKRGSIYNNDSYISQGSAKAQSFLHKLFEGRNVMTSILCYITYLICIYAIIMAFVMLLDNYTFSEDVFIASATFSVSTFLLTWKILQSRPRTLPLFSFIVNLSFIPWIYHMHSYSGMFELSSDKHTISLLVGIANCIHLILVLAYIFLPHNGKSNIDKIMENKMFFYFLIIAIIMSTITICYAYPDY